MASTLIGRTACPECGFPAAHVKRSEPKGTLYRYCPGCGAQYFTRGEGQAARLMEKTRLPDAPAPAATGATATAAPTASASAPAATPTTPQPAAPTASASAPSVATATPNKKMRGLF